MLAAASLDAAAVTSVFSLLVWTSMARFRVESTAFCTGSSHSSSEMSTTSESATFTRESQDTFSFSNCLMTLAILPSAIEVAVDMEAFEHVVAGDVELEPPTSEASSSRSSGSPCCSVS